MKALLCPLSRAKAKSHGFACFNMKDLHSSTLNYTSPSCTRKPCSFSQLGKLEICSFENCRFQDLLLWVETAQLGILSRIVGLPCCSSVPCYSVFPNPEVNNAMDITNCNPSNLIHIYIYSLYNFERKERNLSWTKKSFSTHHNLRHYFFFRGGFSGLRSTHGCWLPRFYPLLHQAAARVAAEHAQVAGK